MSDKLQQTDTPGITGFSEIVLLFILTPPRTDFADTPCLLSGGIATAEHVALGRDYRITPLAGFFEASAILGMLRQKTAASVYKSFLRG